MGIPAASAFRHPFLAGTWRGFWRRWFPSLHVWLRLYIAWPLRNVLPERAFLPLSVLAMGPLLGPKAHFVVWSGLAACILFVEVIWPKKLRPPSNVVWRMAYRLFIVALATVLWIPFHTQDLARGLYTWQCLFSPAGDLPRNGLWWATYRSLPALMVMMAYEAWGMRKHFQGWHLAQWPWHRFEPLLWAALLVAAIYLRGPSFDLSTLTQNLMQ
jgi:D-alanyl-lipoteichoic acid acyltransferase DltB (MBOAT superfamily)